MMDRTVMDKIKLSTSIKLSHEKHIQSTILCCTMIETGPINRKKRKVTHITVVDSVSLSSE